MNVLEKVLMPLTIVDRKLGRIAAAIAITAIGVATGNVQLVVAGVSLFASAVSTPGVQKPETAEFAIKTERPPRVRAYGTIRLYGAYILFENVDGASLDAWVFYDGRAEAIERVYLNDNQVTIVDGVVQPLEDKSYQGQLIRAGYNLGLPTETAFAALIEAAPDIWTEDHRGDGVVTGYLIKKPEQDKHFLETYPQGDNVTMSLVGRWTCVFDPRDPTQDAYDETTWKWSDSAVLALIHYLMTSRGLDWNESFQPVLAQLLLAIEDADGPRALVAGGTEKRWRTALSYKATEPPANVIASLLACFDGWYCLNEAGHVIIHSGRYYEPTVTIGPEVVVGFRHQHGVEDENVVNTIAVPYISDLHDYSTVDAEAWRDETDISMRGKEMTGELGAVVPSHAQGRQLAKIKMTRTNALDRGTCRTTFAGRAVIGERFVNLRLEEAGALFFEGPAEIISLERDTETGGVVFDWVAANPAGWEWNPATEEGMPAPVVGRAAPALLVTPSIISVTPDYSDVGSSEGIGGPVNSTGVRLVVVAEGPTRTDLTWYLRWRVGTGTWLERSYPDTDETDGVTLTTDYVALSTDVQVEVSYATGDGRLSPWSATTTVDTTMA